MKEFRVLTPGEENQLTKEELLIYYKQLANYYKSLPLKKVGMKCSEMFSPILLKILSFIRTKEFIYLNEKPAYKGNALYCFNHSNVNDVPFANEIIGKHNYLLASDENKNDISGLLFKIKGVVFLNREDKNSKAKAKEELIKKTLNGKDLMIFSEGTWNLEESMPMLEISAGIIDIARITEKPIIPVVMEYVNEKVYIKFGDLLYINSHCNRKEKTQELRDSMATLKWEIWETFPLILRENFDENGYEVWKERIVEDYPKISSQAIRELAIKKYFSFEEVFEPINKLIIKK